jgi:hypothetical protein
MHGEAELDPGSGNSFLGWPYSKTMDLHVSWICCLSLGLVVYIFTIVENETIVVEIVGDDKYICDINLATSLSNVESIPLGM